MTWAPAPPGGPFGAVVERWHAGDRFGILCAGDALSAERLYRSLAPSADAAFGNAGAVGPEELATIDGERVVALAWDCADVHPALLRRCTAILRCGHPLPPTRTVARLPADLDAAAVRVLDAAGVTDHGLDVATTRLVRGLRAGGSADPLWVVHAVVAVPRRVRGMPASTDDPFDEQGYDEAGAADPGPGDESGPDEAGPAMPGPGDEAGDEADDSDGDPAEAESVDSGSEPAPSSTDPSIDGPSCDAADGDAAPHTRPPGDAEPSPAAGGAPAATTDADADGDAAAAEVEPGDMALGFAGPGDDPGDAGVGFHPTGPRPRGRRTAVHHLRGARGAPSPSPERGRIRRLVPPERVGGRVAIVPSLHQAARRRAAAVVSDEPTVAALAREDLRGAVRLRRGGFHTVIVVDGSSSLGPNGLPIAGAAAERAMAATGGRRGVVSVIVAAGRQAEVVVARCSSPAHTTRALRTARTGGGTPMASAVRLAIDLLVDDEPARRRALLLTDGRPTVDLGGTYVPASAAGPELSRLLAELTGCVPDVALLPIGAVPATVLTLFAAAGVRVRR